MTPTNSLRPMMLGAFFVIVLGILGYFTLFKTGFSLFKTSYPVVVRFPDANGLREGDTVQVAGLRQGRVETLVYDSTTAVDRRLTVTLKMDEKLVLRQGYKIAIQDSTLLGGKVVKIEPGPPGAVELTDYSDLVGFVAASALTALGDLVEENRASIGRIVANLALLTDDVRAGKGAIGRLFTDEELAKKLGEIGDRLATITNDFQLVSKNLAEGKGALGRLINDEKTGEELSKAVASIRGIADKINNGEGTIGKLVVDPTMGNDLAELIASVRRGENTIGKLFTSSELYDKLAKVADDLAVATDAIRNAKGSVGKLIMDDGLYQQVQRALATVSSALEEYRESAPITAFTGVLFGIF